MRLLRHETHLDDAALLLAAEGELSLREMAHAEHHLQGCAECRTRQSLLAKLEADIRLPSAALGGEAARERLLSSLVAEPAGFRWVSWLQKPRMYVQVGVIAVLLLATVITREAYNPVQGGLVAHEEAGPEPNRAITPGATRHVELREICTLDDSNLDPQVSPEKQRAVFQEYRVDEQSARAYQVDYLINPQLGGNDDIANLWPEPYHATVWNAAAKDALETRLHGMVCSRQIGLHEAQREIAIDWIAAYKKYFHTALPVKTVAALDR